MQFNFTGKLQLIFTRGKDNNSNSFLKTLTQRPEKKEKYLLSYIKGHSQVQIYLNHSTEKLLTRKWTIWQLDFFHHQHVAVSERSRLCWLCKGILCTVPLKTYSYPSVIKPWDSTQQGRQKSVASVFVVQPYFLSQFLSLPTRPRREKTTATVKAMKRLLFCFALFKPEHFNVQRLEFIFCFPYFSSYAFKFKLTNAFVYNFKPSPSLMHQYLVTLPLISLFAMLLSAAWNCQGTKQPNFSLISEKIDSFMNCLFTYAP